MALLDVVFTVVAVVAAMVGLAALAIVGPERLRTTAGALQPRLRAVAPALLLLVLVVLLNGFVRDAGVDLSWLVGVNITGLVYAIEGRFVVHVQSLASPPLTAYFSFVYVYGYAFLLTFPLIAYLALSDPRPLRETAIAYGINYALGLACYVLFVAYGPRNLLSGEIEPLLYTWWPQSQLLTSHVNRNTNVFPSLHSSLSVTVALLAYRTRTTYPRWFPVATWLAASVAVSTMYLGIHWLVDVLAGVVLAAGSVYAAPRLDARLSDVAAPDAVRRFARRLRRLWNANR